jgi:hypothetical protein
MSDEAERETLWRAIPNDTDILVTHGPPQGILDGGQGCPALRPAVIRVKPKRPAALRDGDIPRA